MTGPLFGAIALDNHVDTLVGVWASQPMNRQGGIGHVALARTLDATVPTLINFIEANKPDNDGIFSQA